MAEYIISVASFITDTTKNAISQSCEMIGIINKQKTITTPLIYYPTQEELDIAVNSLKKIDKSHLEKKNMVFEKTMSDELYVLQSLGVKEFFEQKKMKSISSNI